jgi:hypothetical protein
MCHREAKRFDTLSAPPLWSGIGSEAERENQMIGDHDPRTAVEANFGIDDQGRHRDTGSETIAQMRERLNADTPENNRRKAICDAAVAQIERAFGRR